MNNKNSLTKDSILCGRKEILEKNIIYKPLKKKPCSKEIINDLYKNIQFESDEWISLACNIALLSAKGNGGPFGAVILQICSTQNQIIRYWYNHNQVTIKNDPTSHAEINVIRDCCKDLGLFSLSKIKKDESKLFQPKEFSYCIIYSSCEPCPMCYSAIMWSRINNLIFAANRFQAMDEGVDFSDHKIYNDLDKDYSKRLVCTKNSICTNHSEAFYYWKNSMHKKKY